MDFVSPEYARDSAILMEFIWGFGLGLVIGIALTMAWVMLKRRREEKSLLYTTCSMCQKKIKIAEALATAEGDDATLICGTCSDKCGSDHDS
jgi:NhaP-type Na+/H+ and K+/H+ antiporter